MPRSAKRMPSASVPASPLVGSPRHALRRSIKLDPPSPRYYLEDEEYVEAHARGEILVAVVMQAYPRV